MTEDLLTEIKSDYKNERTILFLKKSLPYTIVFTILIVISMLMYQQYVDKKTKHLMLMGDLLLDTENIKNNANLEKESLQYIINNANNHIADIAALRLIFSQNGKTILKELQKVVDNNNYHNITQNYAKLIWVSIALDMDTLTSEQQVIMNTYTNSVNEKEVFWGSLNLLDSLWLIKQNKIDLAIKVLQKVITSHMVGYEVKNQAKAILSNIMNGENSV